MSHSRPRESRGKTLKSNVNPIELDYINRNGDQLVQVVHAALRGRSRDLQLVVRRLANTWRESDPERAGRLMELLREYSGTTSPLRRTSPLPVPLDNDTQLRLLRVEESIELTHEPILSESTQTLLEQLLAERSSEDKLAAAGLWPTRSVLFTGPPGVGKTLAARWLARCLDRPLIVLDLAAVMSSFLGRTGNNVRAVLDYAKEADAVFLIDELDAVAKRRDDGTEVGELKRLVTVLIQEIDDWPTTGLLLAATNHPDLLDPAVWRRFEMHVDFPLPEIEEAEALIRLFLGGSESTSVWPAILAAALRGSSHNDLERLLIHVKRNVALNRYTTDTGLLEVIRTTSNQLSKEERIALALRLVMDLKLPQRQAHLMTGVSRDTLRKRVAAMND